MPTFVLKSLTIHPECSQKVRKNLISGSYPFTTKGEVGFYGKNIMVEAIVGMNGSGKTALLEIIFRMINNFSAYMFRNSIRPVSEQPNYVGGIYADLNYVINGEEGVLKCRDMVVTLSIGGESIRFGKGSETVFPNYRNGDYLSANEINEIASKFFYSVVINYSLQAYCSRDYSSEVSYAYNRKDKKWHITRQKMWIDGLFHKNDGYMTPINLNPYRNDGIIDMNTEMDLTMYRVSAILIEFQRMNKEYVDGYELSMIKYKYEPGKLVKGFKDEYDKESETHKVKRILNEFKKCCSEENPNSYARLILENFKILQHPDKEMAWAARLYLT